MPNRMTSDVFYSLYEKEMYVQLNINNRATSVLKLEVLGGRGERLVNLTIAVT